MTPLFQRDKKTILGFIMIDYEESEMRVLLPRPGDRMPTAQELLDRAAGRVSPGEIVLDIETDYLISQRLSDCGADFITAIWVTDCDPEHLLHLPRELFQTVPEALGFCRKTRRN